MHVDQRSEEHEATLAFMERNGGEFMRHLAKAWQLATPHDHAQLVAAFGDTYYALYRHRMHDEAAK